MKKIYKYTAFTILLGVAAFSVSWFSSFAAYFFKVEEYTYNFFDNNSFFLAMTKKIIFDFVSLIILLKIIVFNEENTSNL